MPNWIQTGSTCTPFTEFYLEPNIRWLHLEPPLNDITLKFQRGSNRNQIPKTTGRPNGCRTQEVRMILVKTQSVEVLQTRFQLVAASLITPPHLFFCPQLSQLICFTPDLTLMIWDFSPHGNWRGLVTISLFTPSNSCPFHLHRNNILGWMSGPLQSWSVSVPRARSILFVFPPACISTNIYLVTGMMKLMA